jgi:hypothetical protein
MGVLYVDTSTPATVAWTSSYNSSPRHRVRLPAVDARLVLVAPLDEMRHILACFRTK